jgi:hypothetical protein
MHTGMLWFDNSSSALSVKIQKAMDYYEKKYGRKPDLCLVHPSMLDAQTKHQLETPALASSVSVYKVTVRPYRPVLPGHLWIGIEDKSKGAD